MSVSLKHFYKFDPFILEVEERVLLRDGRPVAVTPKVFDTLLLLLQNQGRVVSKQKILDTLWPDVFVEESNVTFNITKLRKALGDTKREPLYIETVPRRGYRFKSEVREVLSEDIRADLPEIEVKPFSDNNRTGQAKAATINSAPPAFNTSEPQHGPSERLDNLTVINPLSATRIGRRLTTWRSIAIASVFLLPISGLSIWYFSQHGFGVKQKKSLSQRPLVPANSKSEQVTNYGNVVCAAISPDGKQVAYVLENSGQQSLWLKHLATSVNVQIVTPAYSVYHQLSFSRDAEYIYFIRHAEDEADNLYRIPVLGGPSTKLIPNLEGQFSLSPDETQVAFSRRDRSGREDALYIANIDASDEHLLVTHKEPDWLRAFAWSPDGKVMVCALGETGSSQETITIVEVDIKSGRERLLVRPNWFNVRELQWLPDGSGLLVCVKEKLSARNQIWRLSYPGAAMDKLTDDMNNYLSFSLSADASRMIGVQTDLISNIWVSPNPDGSDARIVAAGVRKLSWTPDGKILYVSRSPDGCDLWLANADGTEPRQLTLISGSTDNPNVSPDGRYIVFDSDHTGAYHVWRMNADGSNQIQLTNGYAEGGAVISADGRWVYYNTYGDFRLWKVAIEGGEPVKLTDQSAQYPSLSPDGQLIAYYQFSNELHKGSITVERIEDMKKVAQLSMAPGSWISGRLHWNAGSTSLRYAVESEGRVRIYEQSLNGAAPRALANFKDSDEFDFGWSPDGRKLAYTSSEWHHDIVLIGGLK